MRGRSGTDGHLVGRPPCGECGAQAALIELVPPGRRPSEWRKWSRRDRKAFKEHRDPTAWWLIYKGIVGGNGSGDEITDEEARLCRQALVGPLRYETLEEADLYVGTGYCADCDVVYCFNHWSDPNDTGYGYCPRGHGQSLDPHWSPDD